MKTLSWVALPFFIILSAQLNLNVYIFTFFIGFQCLATIATVYWRSNEESVEGDKQQKAPVLESRETVPPSGSRADRVQGI